MLSVLNLFPEEHKTNQPAFFSGVKKIDFIREAAIKSSSLNGRAIKASPSPELNGHWNLATK